jgi:hypothetical protein
VDGNATKGTLPKVSSAHVMVLLRCEVQQP